MTGAPKMHADEFETDASLVERLVAAQFPKWAGLPIQPVHPRGTDNALYRLGEDMVVRLPRLERASVGLEKERHWLPRLAPFLPLEVPLPLADGVPAEGFPWPWFVYRWLDGETPTLRRIGNLEQAASDLARFVAALQRIDATDGPPPGPHNVFRGEPIANRDEAVRESIASLGDAIDADWALREWEEALRAPAWGGAPVWIHGDLDARNLLARDGRLSAVIDFGTLGIGDPACEAMVAWKVLAGKARTVFRAALAIDNATWRRARGWALSQAVTALAYYTPATNAVLVGEAQGWLGELKEDSRV